MSLKVESPINVVSFTGNKALISNASKDIVESTITDLELSYMDGATSNIQTQITDNRNLGFRGLDRYTLGSNESTGNQWVKLLIVDLPNTYGYTDGTIQLDLGYQARGFISLYYCVMTALDQVLDNPTIRVTSSYNQDPANVKMILTANVATSAKQVEIWYNCPSQFTALQVRYVSINPYLGTLTYPSLTWVLSPTAGTQHSGSYNILATSARITDLTGSRVVVTDGSDNLVSSSVTTTLLDYLLGLTGGVQGQLDNKIGGSGTATYLPKFTATRTLANSILTDDGTTVSIGLANNVSNPKLNIIQNTGVAGGAEISLTAAGTTSDANSAKIIFQGGHRLIGLTNGAFKVQRNNVGTWNSIFESTSTNPAILDLTFNGAILCSGFSGNKALISGGSKQITESTVTSTEISYLGGVTSGIQAQLNGKQATLTNPVTGTGTSGTIPVWTGTTTLGNSSITDNGSYAQIYTYNRIGGNLDPAFFTPSDNDYNLIGWNRAAGARYFTFMSVATVALGDAGFDFRHRKSTTEFSLARFIPGSIDLYAPTHVTTDTTNPGITLSTFAPNLSSGSNVALFVGKGAANLQSGGLVWIQGATDADSYLTLETYSSVSPIFIKATTVNAPNLILTPQTLTNFTGATQPTYYIGQNMATNDNWRIYGEGSVANTGSMVLETGDDGSEPFIFRMRNNGANTTYDRMTLSSSTLTVNVNVNIPGLTASAVVVTDGSKNLVSSGITTTKLNYLTDVTSNIQAQINGKVSTNAWNSQTIGIVTVANNFFNGSAVGDLYVRFGDSTKAVLLGVWDGVSGTNNASLWYTKTGAGAGGTFTSTGTFTANAGSQFNGAVTIASSNTQVLFIGDDSSLGDCNIVHTLRLRSTTNSAVGYLQFGGSTSGSATDGGNFGYDGTNFVANKKLYVPNMNISGLTASRVVVTDGSNNLVSSSMLASQLVSNTTGQTSRMTYYDSGTSIAYATKLTWLDGSNSFYVGSTASGDVVDFWSRYGGSIKFNDGTVETLQLTSTVSILNTRSAGSVKLQHNSIDKLVLSSTGINLYSNVVSNSNIDCVDLVSDTLLTDKIKFEAITVSSASTITNQSITQISGTGYDITLPSASGDVGRIIIVYGLASGTNSNIYPQSGQTIIWYDDSGVRKYTYQSGTPGNDILVSRQSPYIFVCDGSTWRRV